MHQATAASLVYATQMPDDEEYSTILVFNMGGSSIDASIVEIDGNNIKVKASDGDPYCGGADFDNVLVQHAIKEFHKEHGLDLTKDPRAMVRLRKEAQKVKE
jgi:molecular chaperone DnaK (HSP70)